MLSDEECSSILSKMTYSITTYISSLLNSLFSLTSWVVQWIDVVGGDGHGILAAPATSCEAVL